MAWPYRAGGVWLGHGLAMDFPRCYFLNIADLAVWRLLGWLTSGIIDGVPKDIIEPYQNLKLMRKEVYKHPKVKEWMLLKYGKDI